MKLLIDKFFYPLFFFLFLLSFFLIEGDHKFYLFAAWSIFLSFFWFIFAQKKRAVQPSNSLIIKLVFILSLLFIVGFFFSSLWPLSLEKLVFYLVSLAIFIFFVKISKNKFNSSMFFSYLSIISLILNFIVLFLTFYIPEQNIFPGMNLLVRNYGHNHYVAYLLLVLPVFWWQLFSKTNNNFFEITEKRLLTGVLLFSSYLIVLMSLGRLALFLSLFQLIVIFLFNKKYFFNSQSQQITSLVIKIFLFLFLSINVVFFILSILPSQKESTSICSLVLKKKELCKPLIENIRFTYWRKAWLVFRDRPIFGSGLKTFNYATRQFPLENYQVTSYAHNIFLHNLAEAGLLGGGMFIVFILSLFYSTYIKVRHSKQKLDQFLWLGALFSLLNALFDFDWHFFVIFTLTLIFLAIILQNNPSIERIKDKKPTYHLDFKIYLFFLNVLTIFLVFSYCLSNYFIKQKRFDLIIKYLPFMSEKIEKMYSLKVLNALDYENLYKFYCNDPNFIYSFARAEDTPLEKRVELQAELASIDPAFFIKNVYFGNLNYQQAVNLSDEFISTAQKHHFINNIYFLDYWRQQDLANQFFNFANQAYLVKNTELAANYYQKAILLNSFVMNNSQASFLSTVDLEQATVFLQIFKDFNPEGMGNYFYEYMGFYEKTLLYLFRQNRLDEFNILAQAIFKHQPTFSWFLWRDLIAESKTPADKIRLEKIHEHFKDMETWYDFWPLEK